jgi:hypothetical protein
VPAFRIPSRFSTNKGYRAKVVMPGLVPGIQCVREDALSAG